MISWRKLNKFKKICDIKGLTPKCYSCDIPMGIVRVEGSRGLKVNNLEKWKNSGIEVSKLPNSEWFNESYIAYYWECPDCCHREEFIPEQKVVLVSDEVENGSS